MTPTSRSVLRLILSLALLAAACAGTAGPAAAAKKPRSADRVEGSYIVVYERSVSSPSSETRRLERGKGFRARFRYGRAVKGFSARLSGKQVAALRSDPDVDFVAPDRRVKALGTVPLAAGESAPTGVRRMQASGATTTRSASSADVAVIDTGIDLSHPDLNSFDGKNCVGTGPAQDDQGHGTHVAGSVAARNQGSGVVGVAPGTPVHAVKVLDAQGNGTISGIICGIEWVTATRTDSDPANDIEVANLSLGGVGVPVASCATTTDPMHRAICASTAAGVAYVVAAGNDGWDFDYASAPDTPAAYPEVLTVSALSDSDGKPGASGGAPACRTSEADDRYASFSNFASTAAGQAHTVAAPGVCISSTMPGGGYGAMSGTSMATPHVAGAVALCLNEGGACTGLSPAAIRDKVRADAQRYTTAISTFGFSGDPMRSVTGRYYGYLDWAGDDSVAPQASTVSPAADATGVATTAALTVGFSEPMDRASAQAAFSLRRASDNAPVAGSFSWSGNTMTFRPSAALTQGTSYSAQVGTGARDAAGNALTAERAWSFSTLATANAYPIATVLESGALRSGSYSRLGVDDNVFYEVTSTASGTRTSSWYARVTGVSNSLRSLRVAYRGKSSVTCSQTVSVWRWTTSSWVQLDARSVGATEVLVDRAASGTLADYVSGISGDGEVRVRVRCTHATSAFFTSADLLRVTYTKP